MKSSLTLKVSSNGAADNMASYAVPGTRMLEAIQMSNSLVSASGVKAAGRFYVSTNATATQCESDQAVGNLASHHVATGLVSATVVDVAGTTRVLFATPMALHVGDKLYLNSAGTWSTGTHIVTFEFA